VGRGARNVVFGTRRTFLIRAVTLAGAAQSRALKHLFERGKADLSISDVELGVNILQENATDGPDTCWIL
jgi:hypothetical protein